MLIDHHQSSTFIDLSTSSANIVKKTSNRTIGSGNGSWDSYGRNGSTNCGGGQQDLGQGGYHLVCQMCGKTSHLACKCYSRFDPNVSLETTNSGSNFSIGGQGNSNFNYGGSSFSNH